MVGEPAPPNAGSLAPGVNQITRGGITLVASPDRGRLELHNHTDERLSCAFSTTVPWLAFRQAGAWLEPHGMVEVLMDRGADSPDSPPAAALARASGAAITTARYADPPIYLLAPGLPDPVKAARVIVLPGVAPVSIIAAFSAIAVLMVVFAHLNLLAIEAMEIPVLALAVWIQRRARKRP